MAERGRRFSSTGLVIGARRSVGAQGRPLSAAGPTRDHDPQQIVDLDLEAVCLVRA